MLIVFKPEFKSKDIISEHGYLLTSYLPTTMYIIANRLFKCEIKILYRHMEYGDNEIAHYLVP